MQMNGGSSSRHTNDERTVRCPVSGCDKEVLARGLHLHVRRSSSGNHGEQDSIPDEVNLDDAETVGSKEVSMEYPDERDSEKVARLCPYCERPFRGKQGVMIHLGQMAGRKDHPSNGPEKHDLEDFAIVRVDENENVVEIVEEPTLMPSTERRLEEADSTVDREQVKQHIQDLREEGLDEQADQAEKLLLGK